MTRVPRRVSSLSPKTALRIAYAVLGIAALVLLGFSLYNGAAQLFGTKTTATITSCHTSVTHSYSNHHYTTHRDTTCHGDWTLDGQSHSGEIHGAGADDYAGETVSVHVFHGDAYLSGWAVTIGLGVGGAVCLLAIGVIAWFRRRLARKAVPADTPAGDAPASKSPAQPVGAGEPGGAAEPTSPAPPTYPWSGKDG